MTGVELRPADRCELDRLAALYTACFDEPFSQPAIESLLAMPGAWASIAWVDAGDGARPAGFVIARTVAGEGEILSLGVCPDRRRRGVGRVVLAHVLRQAQAAGARAVYLEVGTDNPAAIALYTSAGFTRVGRRAAYYRRRNRRVDALIMRHAMKDLDTSWKL